ncbi:MAG: hypothetical protein QXT34_01545 [Candidatus Aenigmatarchaeota archaeon]
MVRLRCIFFLFIVFTCFLFSSYSACTKSYYSEAFTDSGCNNKITDSLWIMGWGWGDSCFIGIKSDYNYIYTKSLLGCGKIEANFYRNVSTYKKNDRGKTCVVAHGSYFSCDTKSGNYDDIRNMCMLCNGNKAMKVYGCSGNSIKEIDYSPSGLCSVACGANEFCDGLHNQFEPYRLSSNNKVYCNSTSCNPIECNKNNVCMRVPYGVYDLVCVYYDNDFIWLNSFSVDVLKENLCSDGIDNDCDGKKDAEDEDCWCNVEKIELIVSGGNDYENIDGGILISGCQGKIEFTALIKTDKECQKDRDFKVDIKDSNNNVVTSFTVKVQNRQSTGYGSGTIAFSKNDIQKLSKTYFAVAENNKESNRVNLNFCCVEINSFDLNPQSVNKCNEDIRLKANINYNSIGKCSTKSINIIDQNGKDFCKIGLLDNKNSYSASCEDSYRTPQTSTTLKFFAQPETRIGEAKEASLNVNCGQEDCKVLNFKFISFNPSSATKDQCGKQIQLEAKVDYSTSGNCANKYVEIRDENNVKLCEISVGTNQKSCTGKYNIPSTTKKIKFSAVFSGQGNLDSSYFDVNCEQQCQITNLNLNVTQLSKVNCREDAKFEINVTGSQQNCNNLQALVFIDNQKVGSISCNIKQNNLFECKGNIQHNIQSSGTKEFKVDVNGKITTKNVNLNCLECSVKSITIGDVYQKTKKNCNKVSEFNVSISNIQLENCNSAELTFEVWSATDKKISKKKICDKNNLSDCYIDFSLMIEKNSESFKIIVKYKDKNIGEKSFNALCFDCKIKSVKISTNQNEINSCPFNLRFNISMETENCRDDTDIFARIEKDEKEVLSNLLIKLKTKNNKAEVYNIPLLIEDSSYSGKYYVKVDNFNLKSNEIDIKVNCDNTKCKEFGVIALNNYSMYILFTGENCAKFSNAVKGVEFNYENVKEKCSASSKKCKYYWNKIIGRENSYALFIDISGFSNQKNHFCDFKGANITVTFEDGYSEIVDFDDICKEYEKITESLLQTQKIVDKLKLPGDESVYVELIFPNGKRVRLIPDSDNSDNIVKLDDQEFVGKEAILRICKDKETNILCSQETIVVGSVSEKITINKGLNLCYIPFSAVRFIAPYGTYIYYYFEDGWIAYVTHKGEIIKTKNREKLDYGTLFDRIPVHYATWIYSKNEITLPIIDLRDRIISIEANKWHIMVIPNLTNIDVSGDFDFVKIYWYENNVWMLLELPSKKVYKYNYGYKSWRLIEDSNEAERIIERGNPCKAYFVYAKSNKNININIRL